MQLTYGLSFSTTISFNSKMEQILPNPALCAGHDLSYCLDGFAVNHFIRLTARCFMRLGRETWKTRLKRATRCSKHNRKAIWIHLFATITYPTLEGPTMNKCDATLPLGPPTTPRSLRRSLPPPSRRIVLLKVTKASNSNRQTQPMAEYQNNGSRAASNPRPD